GVAVNTGTVDCSGAEPEGPALPQTDIKLLTVALVLGPPTSKVSVPPPPAVVTPLKNPKFACRKKGEPVLGPKRIYTALIHTWPGLARFPAPMLPRVLVGPTMGKFRFGVAVVLGGAG